MILTKMDMRVTPLIHVDIIPREKRGTCIHMCSSTYQIIMRICVRTVTKGCYYLCCTGKKVIDDVERSDILACIARNVKEASFLAVLKA